MHRPAIILGIESSCDDTAAAVMKDGKILANITAGQEVHKAYGGVVPELASRAHQQHIVPVVDSALSRAGISRADLSAVAFTRGPGLLGSLLVGTSFAKGLSWALDIPLIEVNHMQGHILAHFIQEPDNTIETPTFPFLCLTVSGGHTQIVRVNDYFDMEIIGQTIDDAAGEAFDKIAKIMGLPYPGGPLIDKYGRAGNPEAFTFPIPKAPGLNFSYSGLKTSVLYFLRKELAKDPAFIEKHRDDLCASVQAIIVKSLILKLKTAAKETGISEIAIAGGVSANSALRNTLLDTGRKLGWNVFIPKFEYCTDNAAMIAIAGHHKYLKHEFAGLASAPSARLPFGNG